MGDTGDTSTSHDDIHHENVEWLTEPRTFWASLGYVSDLEWITVKQFQAYEQSYQDSVKQRREHYERLLDDTLD